jgi:hypothetical protein
MSKENKDKDPEGSPHIFILCMFAGYVAFIAFICIKYHNYFIIK